MASGAFAWTMIAGGRLIAPGAKAGVKGSGAKIWSGGGATVTETTYGKEQGRV